MELKLSAPFEKKGEQPCLECTAMVLNINYGQNKELMQGCGKLYEYSFFINQVCLGLSEGMVLGAAIDEAVNTCIRQGILAEFLQRHRMEAREMFLSDYDEERPLYREKLPK